jgi:PAS domain S-box-containing protein
MVTNKQKQIPLIKYRVNIANDDLIFLLALFISFFSLSVILLSNYFNWNFSWLLRYVALIPVLFISYHFGVIPGLISASFFSIIYLPELIIEARVDWSSFATIQNLGFIILIHTVSYLVSSITFSLQKEQSLSETVNEWGELFSRIKDIDEMKSFIIEQSRQLLDVDYSMLIVREPLSAQWEVITEKSKRRINRSGIEHGELYFFDWILQQNSEITLNFLDRRPSMFREEDNNETPPAIVSLLLSPLRNEDGSLLGHLVLVNKKGHTFVEEDFQKLKGLILGSERSLEQAGFYVRTDYSLAKRVNQLAAIQRTARELNANLVPDDILEKTLACALEITDADSGLIYINDVDTKPVIRSYNETKNRDILNVVERIQKDRISDVNIIEQEYQLPHLASNEDARMLVPIRKENVNLGYLMVESSSPNFLKDSARYVLSILTDHAAIALENSRLFHEIEAGQLRFSTIINSLSEGVVTTDMHGRIVSYNPAAEKHLAITLGDFVGDVICNVLQLHQHGEDFSLGQCDLLEIIKYKQSVFERKISLPDNGGRKKMIAFSVNPIPPTKGHPEGAVFMLRDITQQVEDEQLQRELIAAISHELRAPLANISTITETMMSYSDEPSAKPFLGYISKLISQTQRLATFSDRILDVYQMETGKFKMQLRPIPIHFLVTQVTAQWQSNITHSISTKFVEEKSPWVWGDEKAIESILNNLIENAIKYSPKNTRVEIIVERPEKGFVQCGVRDQGPGIPEILREKIFDRFYRIDGGDSQKVYGHGLGLYIARYLVEMMGGKIWVNKNEEGKGSHFIFSLPLMEESSE